MKFMFVLFLMIAISFVVINLILHETGHAVACINRDVELKEAGIGLPKGPRLRFNVPKVPFPLTITTTLIGAYVDTTDEGEEVKNNLHPRERAVIYGSGVIANLMLGLAVLSLSNILFKENITPVNIAFSLSAWAAAVLLWRFRGFVSYILMPIAGLAFLVYLVYLLLPSFTQDFVYATTHGGAVEGGSPLIISMVGIVDHIAGLTHVSEFVLWFVLISIAMGTTNMLPLKWLDGSLIFENLYERVFKKKVPSAAMNVTAIFLVFLTVVSLWGDVAKLF